MRDPAEDVGRRLVAFLPGMRRYALALTRSADAADDLVQATAERVVANAHRFEAETGFEAWVLTIMRNLWIDRARRRKTAPAETSLEEGATTVGSDGRRLAEARLELSDVAAAIGALPVDQREVMVLVCVEELTYAEAAGVLGVPVGTVMSRLARARRRLAAILGIAGAP